MSRNQRRLAKNHGAGAARSAALSDAFEAAVRHQRGQRLAEAGRCYRRALAINPRHPDSLYGLGVVAYQTGDYEGARRLIGQAIDILPDAAAFHGALGHVQYATVARVTTCETQFLVSRFYTPTHTQMHVHTLTLLTIHTEYLCDCTSHYID